MHLPQLDKFILLVRRPDATPCVCVWVCLVPKSLLTFPLHCCLAAAQCAHRMQYYISPAFRVAQKLACSSRRECHLNESPETWSKKQSRTQMLLLLRALNPIRKSSALSSGPTQPTPNHRPPIPCAAVETATEIRRNSEMHLVHIVKGEKHQQHDLISCIDINLSHLPTSHHF